MVEKLKCDFCQKERLVMGFLNDKRKICMRCYKDNIAQFGDKLIAIRNSDGTKNAV